MIYRNTDRQICIQNSKLNYAFQSFYKYNSLSIKLEETRLGYVPIGPTNLVEWKE